MSWQAPDRGRLIFFVSVAIGLLLGLFLLPITDLHVAAQTSQSLSCVTEEGANPVGLSLMATENATVTPASLLCNGSTVTVTASGNGTVLAVVQTASNTNMRAILSGDLQSEQIASCSSKGCSFNATQLLVYSQVDVYFSYRISGGGSGYDPPLLSYYFEDATRTSPLGTYIWIDCCSSEWQAPMVLGGSTISEQWAANPSDTQGVISSSSAGSTIVITYYNQYPITASFSVTSGIGYESPQLRYSEYGIPQSASTTTNPASYWADAGTSWRMSEIVPGSLSSEQWAASSSSVLSGNVTKPTTVSPLYYNQYLVSTSYTIVGQGSSGYSNPVLYYTSLGSGTSTNLTMTPIEYWIDAGSPWNTTNELPGNSTSQRWQTDQPTSGIASSAGSITITYYWQYLVTFQYSVMGGGTSYIPPTLNYTQFGAMQAGSPGTSAWTDVGSNCSFTNPLIGSTSAERWFANSATPTISSSAIDITYYHQYSYSLNYSVIDGGQGYSSPIFSYTAFGSAIKTLLSTSTKVYWLDSDTFWSTSSQLTGSSAQERWATPQTIESVATASAKVDFDFFNQYALKLNYRIALGGTPPAPTLNYTLYSSPISTHLSTLPTVYWVDASSSWSLSKSLQLAYTASSERWITNMTTNMQPVSGVFNDTYVYDHQFYLLVQLNDAQGGSSNAAIGWYNAGNNVSIAASANAGWEFVSWNGTGLGSYTGPQINATVDVTSPVNETAIFYAELGIISGPNGLVQYDYGNQSGSQTGTILPSSSKTIYVLPYTEVNLTETPASVIYVFHGWSGDARGSSVSTLVDVNTPESVKASFDLDITDITVFIIVTLGVIILSFGAFPVRFKIRAISIKKKSKFFLKRSIFFSTLLLLLALLLVFNPNYSTAATSWASVSSIRDLTGGTTVQSGQALIAGHAYNLTISIAIPFNQTSSQFQVSLNQQMQPQGAQYWYVETPNYAGFNATSFTAGDKTVSFTQIQGQLVLSAEFAIPVNLTLKSAPGLVLHFPQIDFPFVTVKVSGGSQVGNISLTVEDQTIETYLTTYQQDSTLISSGKIASSYSSFVNNILNQSQSLYSQGLVSQATSLLGVLTSSSFPAPPSNTSSTLLAVGLVVVLIIAVVFAFMAFRRRGQSSVASTVVSDVQRELAMLEVTATRYDKSLAEKLKALRERLNDAL